MPKFQMKNKSALKKWKLARRKVKLMNKVIVGDNEFTTNSKQLKSLFGSSNNDDRKEVDIYFKNGKNFIDELFLELTTSDIMVENIPIIFVRYYNFLFIIRYLVIQVILVTLQRLGVFQAIIILGIQGTFIFFALRTHIKLGGLYENQFLAYYNLIQEVCIFIFLLITILIGLNFVNWTGERGLFYIEMVAALSLMISLIIEVFGFLIIIVGFVIWIYNVASKYLCVCYDDGEDEEDKGKRSDLKIKGEAGGRKLEVLDGDGAGGVNKGDDKGSGVEESGGGDLGDDNSHGGKHK